jgi:hypothetical protein
MKSKKAKVKRKGSALLVVLFIVMAITILSLGFLSRSDVELACGENMILRTQMDYLAESGLEHARGRILYDNNCPEGNWQFSDKLYDGNDYYDVNVVYPSECNYVITCNAYREKEKNGEKIKIGQSSLKAELRLDPCIAFWTQTGTTVPSGATINGDVYCGGTLTNSGTINGDVFADVLSGNSIEGRQKTKEYLLLLLDWPVINSENYLPYNYDYPITDSNLTGGEGIVHCPNDIALPGDVNTVNIAGMLIVEGSLTITGRGTITADEGRPAMLVNNDLIIEAGGSLVVDGLVVVQGEVRNSGNIEITGGLFVENGITGSGNITITAAPSRTTIITWPSGNPERWSPVGGAFFKSIER